MNVYISVPMTGRTVKEVEKDIRAAKKDFPFGGRKTKYFSNLDLFKKGQDVDPILCLSEALQTMSSCDAIYVCPGWKDSKGCRIEIATALIYGIPVYGLDTDSAEYTVRIQRTPRRSSEYSKYSK